MASEFFKDPITTKTVIQLPKYNEDTFSPFVAAVRESMYPIPFNGEIEGEHKNILDAVSTWWRTEKRTHEFLDRYKEAFSLEGVPFLEQRQAKESFEESQHSCNQIIWGIDLFLHSSKRSWEKVESLVELINSWRQRKHSGEQIVALCEAISESKDLGLTDNEIRMRIAQSAWEELLNNFSYAKLLNNELSTVDELELEKTQFLEVLKSSPWTHEKRRLAGIQFYKFKNQMKKGEYDLQLRRNFKLLFNCSMGEIPKQKSAIDILVCQEAIFRQLYKEDAFLFEEEEDEGDEEDSSYFDDDE